MILDIGRYQYLHPGGMFLLSYNVGRDISKFYYGGYQLQNKSFVKTHHNHTALAHQVVKTLVVGILNDKAEEFQALVDNKKTVKHTSVHTIHFSMQKPVSGV